MEKSIHKLEKHSTSNNFWINKEKAYDTLKKIKKYNKELDIIITIDSEYDLLKFHIDIINNDKTVSEESIKHLNTFKENNYSNIKKWQKKLVFNN